MAARFDKRLLTGKSTRNSSIMPISRRQTYHCRDGNTWRTENQERTQKSNTSRNSGRNGTSTRNSVARKKSRSIRKRIRQSVRQTRKTEKNGQSRIHQITLTDRHHQHNPCGKNTQKQNLVSSDQNRNGPQATHPPNSNPYSTYTAHF